MRKILRSFAVIAALAAPLSLASAQQFGVGKKLFSIGVLGGGTTGYGIGGGVAFEAGFKELAPDWTLGLGGFVGYTQKTYNCGFAAACEYTTRAIPIAAIGNVHYKMKNQPKADVYGGLSLGFTNFSSSYKNDFTGGTGDFGASSGLGLGLQIGGRYDFTPKVAGLVQLGGGSNSALFFAGLTFKM